MSTDETNDKPAQWCQRDEHGHYGLFQEFNEWIDSSEEASTLLLLQKLRDSNIAEPSKAFFAGDKAAYEQAFAAFQIDRSKEVLSQNELVESLGNDDGMHWYERNEQRLNQLIERMEHNTVVPFIGAGVSNTGGFPTWEAHLHQQGRTAGIEESRIEQILKVGQYEEIISVIEQGVGGTEVFAQEIRDTFGKSGKLPDITLCISEIFSDALITTNYDPLLEQAFDTGSQRGVQIINSVAAMEPPDPTKTTIYKLHGDAKSPSTCILGKDHYDQAYGENSTDLGKPIPKLLGYHYTNSNLLFIGCSLNHDRTLQVFQAVKDANKQMELPQHFAIVQAPDDCDELVTRNMELAALGITAIWYPRAIYEKIEAILRHAQDEVQRRISRK